MCASYKKQIFVWVFVGVISLLVSCGGLSSSTSDTEYSPTWIAASWSGGAIGEPTDRTDVEAENWLGLICPATSVELSNYTEGNVLNIINNCEDQIVTYYLCVSAGSETQPTNGMEECATDPFDTPITSLTIVSLTDGDEGDFINTTQNLSVNIFFCSDSQQLIGPPLFDAPLACL